MAVEAVLAALGGDPPAADLKPQELTDLFGEINQAILAAVAGSRPPRGDSATTLLVALVATGRVQWASAGDSIACVAAPGDTRLLSTPTRRYLGYPLGSASTMISQGSAAIPPGSWVVLATDGYSDWAPVGDDLARATALWTAGAPDAGTVVDRLMDKARVGGAGDNVGIAVARR